MQIQHPVLEIMMEKLADDEYIRKTTKCCCNDFVSAAFDCFESLNIYNYSYSVQIMKNEHFNL